MDHSPRRRFDASRWFFPLASGYGGLVPLLTVLSMSAVLPGLPGLGSPLGHAHEMLFGFAGAVVAGFLLRRVGQLRLIALLLMWLAGRLFYLTEGPVWESWLADGGFFLVLVVPLVRHLAISARKWRNHTTTGVLTGLALLALSGQMLWNSPGGEDVVRMVLLLFSILLAFMGGRILAALVSAPLRARRADLPDRVQLPVESVQIIGLVMALTVQWWPRGLPLAGLLVMLSGLATVVRLLRWRKAFVSGGRDLRLLGFGYLWLGLGLLALGSAMAWAPEFQHSVLHLFAVGGLGTLTLVQMVRVALARVDRRASLPPTVWIAVGLIWLAAVLRLATLIMPQMTQHLWLFAAVAWLGGFVWCLAYQALLLKKDRLATSRREVAA